MTVAVTLLTQQEVADILRRDVKTVQRLRERGELGYLPGRPVLIPQTELDAYLERHMIKRQVVDAPASVSAPTGSQRAPAAASTGGDDAAQKQADLIIAKMKRDGSLAGLIRLQREVAHQERQAAARRRQKATSRRHSHTNKSAK